MKFLAKLTLIATVALGFNNSYATTEPLKNCKQLEASNSVLLVHATWCSYCKRYLPTYEAVSNRPDMKNYKFYTLLNNNSKPVCGQTVSNYPTTLINNLREKQVGAISYGQLINFVKSTG